MRARGWLVEFLATFALSFAVTAVVTLAWSFVAEDHTHIDWGTAFRFGVILGVVIPSLARWGARKKG